MSSIQIRMDKSTSYWSIIIFKHGSESVDLAISEGDAQNAIESCKARKHEDDLFEYYDIL